jgi:uncharacterized membrane protein YesL
MFHTEDFTMAGFFGFFDYTRPGKGVRKDEPKRSHFAMFWILLQRKFFKIIQTNFLFLVCCLPLLAVIFCYLFGFIPSLPVFFALLAVSILPVGPGAAGMTYILRNFANEQPVFLLSDFWDTFRSNFRQAAIYGYLVAAVGIALYWTGSFYSLNAPQNPWMYVPLCIILFLAITFLLANFTIFLMIVTLDLPLPAIIKNGFLLGGLCLKSNLFTLLWVGLLGFLFWRLPVICALLYAIIGCAFAAFLIIHNSYRGVKKYTIDPYFASLETAAEETAFDDDGNAWDDEK